MQTLLKYICIGAENHCCQQPSSNYLINQIYMIYESINLLMEPVHQII